MRDYPLSHVLPYVNHPDALGHHLGLKGNVEELLAAGDERTINLKETVDDIMKQAQVKVGLIRKRCINFSRRNRMAMMLLIYDPEDHAEILNVSRFRGSTLSRSYAWQIS